MNDLPPTRPVTKLLDLIEALGDDADSLRVHGIVNYVARLRELRILTAELRRGLEIIPSSGSAECPEHERQPVP